MLFRLIKKSLHALAGVSAGTRFGAGAEHCEAHEQTVHHKRENGRKSTQSITDRCRDVGGHAEDENPCNEGGFEGFEEHAAGDVRAKAKLVFLQIKGRDDRKLGGPAAFFKRLLNAAHALGFHGRDHGRPNGLDDRFARLRQVDAFVKGFPDGA